MKNYHTFRIKNQNYVYFIDYKQCFELSDKEYNLFNNDDETIYEEYRQYLDEDEKVQYENVELNDLENVKYNLYICVSNACNARCLYCYAHHGNYGKKEKLMDEETAKKAIDFYMKKVPEKSTAIITFFGGEPLLAFDLIKKVCEYIELNYKNRDFIYSITTNGTLLDDEIICFLKAKKFRIGLSIDGGARIQNYQRPLINGEDSFESLTKNLPLLISDYDKICARGTYYSEDCDLVNCYEEIKKLGIMEINIVPDFLNMTDKKMKEFLNQLDKWYDYVLNYINTNKDFPFTSLILRIRKLFTYMHNNDYKCGLGKTMFAVDAFGDIYPCHRFGDIEDAKIGSVAEVTIKDFKLEHKKRCDNCWNKNTCTHGCSYEDYKNGKEMDYFCMYSKKLTEMSISICGKLNPEMLKKIVSVQ